MESTPVVSESRLRLLLTVSMASFHIRLFSRPASTLVRVLGCVSAVQLCSVVQAKGAIHGIVREKWLEWWKYHHPLQ